LLGILIIEIYNFLTLLLLLGTQDGEKQNKNTTQYVLVGHRYTQTKTNNVNKA
jgi:hypothetical protein